MRTRGIPGLLGLPLLCSACELTEVTVPTAAPQVVVHAVLRPDEVRQFVLVEEALTGTAPPRPPGLVPPGGVVRGITGALVTVAVDSTASCAPAVDTLFTAADDVPGVYESRDLCLAPGAVAHLVVVTPDGRTVRGTTRIPELRSATVVAGDQSLTGSGSSALRLHRGRDDILVGVEASFARGIQVEVRRALTAPESPISQSDLVFYLFSDSLGMRLPGDLVNPFEGDSGEVVFRAGLTYDLTVAVTDTNYYDFVRSRTDPFTGRGFINRLEGGIGVFGSLDGATWPIEVVDDIDDPREGTYRMQGDMAGLAVDLALELYVDEFTRGGFAAFVAGAWHGGQVRLSLEGRFAEEGADPDRFEAAFQQVVPQDSLQRWVFRGRRATFGASFPVEVLGSGPISVVDTLTAVQLSGPGG